MAHVIIRREGRWRDALRRYSVYIDGDFVGKLKPRSAFHFEVSEGVHTVQVTVDMCGSKPHAVFATHSHVVLLKCTQHADPRDIMRGLAKPLDYLRLDTENLLDCARDYVARCIHVARNKQAPAPLTGLLDRQEAQGALMLMHLAQSDPKAQVASSCGSKHDMLWSSLVEIGWLSVAKFHQEPVPMRSFELTEHGRTELLDLLV